MGRRLFSDLHPVTYKIAVQRQRAQRHLLDAVKRVPLSTTRAEDDLPVKIYAHNSLIRRRLGNTEQHLQEGKAKSLALSAPLVDGILIRPGETFSFWKLVGNPTEARGFQPGVVISGDSAAVGIGGGMCQFTNLLHWMALHSPLEIVEHHHHSGLDLFPDFKRQIPFGTGTSIIYNFLDYRLYNPTEATFQFRTAVDDDYLRGQLRSDREWHLKYHVHETDAYFYEAPGKKPGETVVRRHNVVLRDTRSKTTGNTIASERIVENDALVCYDRDLINGEILPERPASTV
jgi:vancomycin resistance protein VanW